MSFTWPYALLLLLAVPLLLGAYLLQKKRKRRTALSFSNVALVRSAIPAFSKWKRRIPLAAFLLALGSLSFASARPAASIKVPLGRTSIILALDVSRSMCVTDVKPNRLTDAQDAAREFVRNQRDGTRIGIVAFAGFAELVVPPTTDKAELVRAIDGFTTARGTAIGSATLKSIDAISSINPDVAPIDAAISAESGDNSFFDPNAAVADSPNVESSEPVEVPAEGYIPDIVVLLTDGANTRGIAPLEAAKQAVSRRVRVYTIGFGTTNPSDPVCTAEQLGGEAFGGGFGGAGGNFGGGGAGRAAGLRPFLVADEPTLKEIARQTGGKFFKAEDADQLRKVFDELPRQVVLQRRKVELSALFAGIGALFATIAIGLGMLWNRTT